MPMPIIPKALYPLVPALPGVPALVRNAVVVADAATLGVFGLTNILDTFIGQPVQWGIFDATGRLIAEADSFAGLDYQNSSRLLDYPVEQGGFASFNKVANPFNARVRLVCGGSTQRRAAFIDAIEAAAQSLELFDILTPEVTYLSANIEGWDYRRQAREGATIIIADLRIREIRQTVSVAFYSPKSVSAASPQSQGQVQPAPVTDPGITATEFA